MKIQECLLFKSRLFVANITAIVKEFITLYGSAELSAQSQPVEDNYLSTNKCHCYVTRSVTVGSLQVLLPNALRTSVCWLSIDLRTDPCVRFLDRSNFQSVSLPFIDIGTRLRKQSYRIYQGYNCLLPKLLHVMNAEQMCSIY